MRGQIGWERERPALERLGERMHEGREGRRMSRARGRAVTGQGEWCGYPGEQALTQALAQALAQGQREGQSGGRTTQAREHVLGGPGGLSEVNHLVRES